MWRLSAVLVLILALSGCVAPTERLDGRKFLERQDGPKISSQEELLKNSAEKAVKERDFNRAGQFYTQLVDKYPDNLSYKIGIAESFRRLGDNEAALKAYDAILAKDGKNIEALEGKGLALMGKGEFTAGGKIFEEVLSLDKTRWRTLNAAGVLFAMKNLVPEATAYYDQALASSPGNASILNNKALTLAMDKQYDEAIHLLSRAAQGAQADSREKIRLDLNLALVYAVAGKLDEAQKIASQHLQGRELYNNMGYYAYLAKDKDMAKSYLNMALTKSPAYYDKAWQNLEALDRQENPAAKGKAIKLKDGKPEAASESAAPAPFQAAAPVNEAKPAPAKKSEKKSSKKSRAAKSSKKEAPVKAKSEESVEKPAELAEPKAASPGGFSIAPTAQKPVQSTPAKEDALLKMIQSK